MTPKGVFSKAPRNPSNQQATASPPEVGTPRPSSSRLPTSGAFEDPHCQLCFTRKLVSLLLLKSKADSSSTKQTNAFATILRSRRQERHSPRPIHLISFTRVNESFEPVNMQSRVELWGWFCLIMLCSLPHKCNSTVIYKRQTTEKEKEIRSACTQQSADSYKSWSTCPPSEQTPPSPDKQPTPSIVPLDTAPQPLPPKTTNAVLLAPLLHHPSLDLVPHNLPLIDLRRSVFLLPPLGLDSGLDPLELGSDALGIEPSSEIFQDDGIVEQDLLVPGRRSRKIGVFA
jgi:hypothetical protein